MKRLTYVCLAALMLVQGCSGRPLSVSPGAFVPTAQAVPAAQDRALSKADQALETDAALAMMNTVRLGVVFATVIQKIKGGAQAAASAPVCKNGVEQEVTQKGKTIEYYLGVFYDSACTKQALKSNVTATIDSVTSKSVSFSVAGKLLGYTTAGQEFAKGQFGGKGASGTSGTNGYVHGVLVPNTDRRAALRFGLSCDLPAKGTNECGFGGINRLISQKMDLGITTSLSGFTDDGTSDGTISMDAFKGPVDTLLLVRTGDLTWGVRRGTKFMAQNGTFHEVANRATLALAVTLKATDSAIDAKVNARLRSRAIAGTVTSTTSAMTPATFGVDPLGSGLLKYSDGSTGKILVFVVL